MVKLCASESATHPSPFVGVLRALGSVFKKDNGPLGPLEVETVYATSFFALVSNSLAGSGTLATSGVALLYVSAGLALWSLAVYMRKIWKVLSK
ncbi:hypothetical protein KSS87_002719 [Heliosperma pusillum]|nr:hypothetical protein KSS87_002719 [Heliosperma pusillum]